MSEKGGKLYLLRMVVNKVSIVANDEDGRVIFLNVIVTREGEKLISVYLFTFSTQTNTERMIKIIY